MPSSSRRPRAASRLETGASIIHDMCDEIGKKNTSYAAKKIF